MYIYIYIHRERYVHLQGGQLATRARGGACRSGSPSSEGRRVGASAASASHMYVYLSISISISLYISLSLSLYIHIYVCMCIYIYIYIATFTSRARTSPRRMTPSAPSHVTRVAIAAHQPTTCRYHSIARVQQYIQHACGANQRQPHV